VLWRQENLANDLRKGKQVYVEGRLQTRSFDDRDGIKRYVAEIVADGVILLAGQQGDSQDQQASGKGNNNDLVSRPRGRTAGPSVPPDDFSRQEITDNDVHAQTFPPVLGTSSALQEVRHDS
jgi:single-strand DNA-binding protein